MRGWSVRQLWGYFYLSCLISIFNVAEAGTHRTDFLNASDLRKEIETIKGHPPSPKLVFDIDNSPVVPTPRKSSEAEEAKQIQTPQAGPLVLLNRDGWALTFSGFVEFDMISDSTRSLTEVVGNTPIDPPSKSAGANGRTQFSIRNTRFAFNVAAPELDSWKTKGYIETDFLGFDPNPPVGNTESGLFNNPTLRVRQAYLQGNTGGFQVLGGQTWELFGWQPYYFLATDENSPIPAMLYNRTAQLRVMQTLSFKDFGSLQGAVALVRPPQRDSGYPDVQAGLRIALDGRTSGFTGGAAGSVKTQPMSLGISGLVREISIPTPGGGVGDNSNFLGSAYALDAMIPIIASSDGKDVSNTLSFIGEYSSGSGYGDQFSGWTGNMASPLASSTSAPSKNLSLDAGIGDYDSSGTFRLVELTSLNLQLQYHFPSSWRTFLGLGGGYLYSGNINSILPQGGLTSAGKVPYNRESVGYANLFHCFTDQLRVGVEYAHMETTYGDGSVGLNNRYQVTTLFIF